MQENLWNIAKEPRTVEKNQGFLQKLGTVAKEPGCVAKYSELLQELQGRLQKNLRLDQEKTWDCSEKNRELWQKNLGLLHLKKHVAFKNFMY